MKKKLFKVENIFIIVCLFWGLLFAIVTPPFQAPDEPEHLFKMWGYTQGSLNYRIKDGWVGNYIPESFSKLYTHYNQFRWKYEKIPADKTNQFLNLKLEKNKKVFQKYNAPVYTPLSYFPAFLVLWVLKLLNIAPLLMTYLMRICFLLLYTALGYFAIKITPCKKWMFFLMQTLPLLLSQAAAINTDAVFFGVVFLFYAYTLRLRFDESIEKVSKRQICIWGGLSVFISILKFAYAPLCLLYFLIPREKTEFKESYYKYFLTIFLCNLIAILYFTITTVDLKGFREYSYNENLSTSVVLVDIIKHPLNHFYAIWETTKLCLHFYIINLVSNIGTTLSTIPLYATHTYLGLLALSALYTPKKEENMTFDFKNKFLLAIVIVASYIIVLTSVYLVYQYYPIIRAMQGRYLTPLVPAFLLLLCMKKFKTENKCIPWIIFLVSQFLLLITIFTFMFLFY